MTITKIVKFTPCVLACFFGLAIRSDQNVQEQALLSTSQVESRSCTQFFILCRPFLPVRFTDTNKIEGAREKKLHGDDTV